MDSKFCLKVYFSPVNFTNLRVKPSLKLINKRLKNFEHAMFMFFFNFLMRIFSINYGVGSGPSFNLYPYLANYFDTFFVMIFCYIYMTFYVQTTWWRSSEGRDQSTPKNVAAWRAPCAGTVSTFSSRLGCGTDWPPPCTTATGTATP